MIIALVVAIVAAIWCQRRHAAKRSKDKWGDSYDEEVPKPVAIRTDARTGTKSGAASPHHDDRERETEDLDLEAIEAELEPEAAMVEHEPRV